MIFFFLFNIKYVNMFIRLASIYICVHKRLNKYPDEAIMEVHSDERSCKRRTIMDMLLNIV